MKIVPACFVILAAALWMAASGCATATAYRGAAVEGWVVDSETQRPIENAIVAIKWALEGGLHPDVIGSLLLQETVTDANGHYAFPAWGPLKAKDGYVTHSAPDIVAFKLGYLPKPFWNAHDDWRKPLPDPLVSRWNGKKLVLTALPPGEFGDRGYGAVFGGLYHSHRPCDWEQIPRMTAAMIEYGRPFETPFGGAIPHISGPHPHGCRDPKVFLGEYLRD